MRKKILTIIILVLVLSFFVIKGSYALYRNIVNPSADIAAATWSVTLNQTGENNNLSVVAGDENSTASYTVNITSISQVDIIYSIVVEDIPEGIIVKLDDGEYQTPTNGQVIYTDVSTINYSDTNKTKSHILTFKANSNAAAALQEEININVIARQVLAN